MNKKIKRVKLFCKDVSRHQDTMEKLEREFRKYHFEVVDEDYDLVVSVGGDGSFLRMVNQTGFDSNVYYIGLNAGTLGFLQEIDEKTSSSFVARLKEGNYQIEEINLAEIRIVTHNKEYYFTSLNEVIVRESDLKVLSMDVYVNGALLEHFYGDGLLISTPTGSTAHNMSYGGSIIYPSISALSLTPIAPLNNRAYQTLANPIIVPDKTVIRLIPIDEVQSVFVIIDGKNQRIDDVLKIEIVMDSKKINVLRMSEYHFIDRVRDKLVE